MTQTDAVNFARCYSRQLIRFAQSAPASNKCFLHTLQNTAYVVIAMDATNLLVHLATEDKLEVGDGRGGVLSPGTPEEPRELLLRGSVEEALFPGIRISPSSSAGITVNQRWLILEGLAFCNPAFAGRYWKNERFYRHCAEDLPLRVTPNGDVLGIDLLYGWEEYEAPRTRLLEVIRIFGSQCPLPNEDIGIEDLAWSDFAHGIPSGRKTPRETDWSFGSFLKSLEAPASKTVLLLGSYQSPTALDEATNAFAELGYNPITLRDAPDLPFQTTDEKFLAGVICSAFVVIVDTVPSGHLSELTLLLNLRFRPVIILRQDASPASWFQEDRVQTDDLFRVVVEPSFTGRNLAEHAKWAQATVANRIKKINAVNRGRNSSLPS